MASAELNTRRRSDFLLGGVALANVLLHLPFLRSYGWFRDELHYLVCGRHLDFGYVDHPPLMALLARLLTTAFGDSLPALRLKLPSQEKPQGWPPDRRADPQNWYEKPIASTG